jgi:two-component system, NtrC family, response regulator AlgB
VASILIVDDEKNIRAMMASHIRGLGHATEVAADGAAALKLLSPGRFDVVFSDVRMPGLDGLALLRQIKERRLEAVVVLMTAYATVAQAVEAMRGGAYDYLVKPFSIDEITLLLSRVLEVQALRRENRTLRGALDRPVLVESGSAKMSRVFELARQAAASEATILLTGESGTGKTVLARQIHDWSPRRERPFVTIACTTLAEHLLESELFGHVKGAFTGAWKDKPGRLEAAAGGTVFLDEIGELSPALQAKLLQFLEEKRFERVGGNASITIDVRVIAATNRNLETEVAERRFREDLYFRLNVVGLSLPPLRERREDLQALTDHVVATLATRHGRATPSVPEDTRRVLEAYEWPGNVRELVNVVERAIVLSTGDSIRIEDLPDRLLAPQTAEPSAPNAPESLEALQRKHIERVLAESATLEEASARLGINVTTLWRKRKRYGIE